MRDRDSSPACGWDASSTPTTSAPTSPAMPTSSNSPYPSTTATLTPNSACSSPWPTRSQIRYRIRRPGTSRTSSSAQGLGGSPLDSDRKITAATSCMTSTPTAMRPYSAVVSERSSSTLTTNTVEEKRQREPDERERAERLAAEEAEPDHGEQAEEAERDRDADPQVHERGQPDLAAQQGADVELQPDREEQQDDPEVRDRLQVGQLRCTHGAEGEAGGEEADERRETQEHREEPAEQCGAEVQGRCCHEVPLARAVVRSPILPGPRDRLSGPGRTGPRSVRPARAWTRSRWTA